MGMSRDIIRLLEDKEVLKVGLSLHDDILMLHKLADFKPGKFIDLQEYVGEIGIEDRSLQKLYANIFGQKISKGQRLTNWEADVLNDSQKLYAATDAWACIMLYEELLQLKHNSDYKLIKTRQWANTRKYILKREKEQSLDRFHPWVFFWCSILY